LIAGAITFREIHRRFHQSLPDEEDEARARGERREDEIFTIDLRSSRIF